MPFSEILISQGSVATSLRLGGIFKREFDGKLTAKSASEKRLKSVDNWRSYVQEFDVLFFDSQCREVARTRSYKYTQFVLVTVASFHQVAAGQ